jgi:(1->4)-alpha-D-glucan 1-alpha-D-glucosylmutase
MLAELQAGLSLDEIMNTMDSGMPKLWVIYKALHLRRDHPEWFGESSSYAPLTVEGSKQAHLIAFCRGDSVAVLAPRWNVRLGSGFGATTVDLPSGRWTNILSGEEVSGGKNRAQELFERFPVALLVREAGASDASI